MSHWNPSATENDTHDEMQGPPHSLLMLCTMERGQGLMAQEQVELGTGQWSPPCLWECQVTGQMWLMATGLAESMMNCELLEVLDGC